jgi:hypothetical protein
VVEAIEDVLVVEGDDGSLEQAADDVRERIEVGDDGVRIVVEAVSHPDLDVVRERRPRDAHVLNERAPAMDRAALVGDPQSVNRNRVCVMAPEDDGRATGSGDLDLVTCRDEVLDERPRSHRVAEAFSRDAVEDLHTRSNNAERERIPRAFPDRGVVRKGSAAEHVHA